MESTIYFQTKGGNGYLYDNQTSYMINCHPIVNEFRIASAYTKEKIELFNIVAKKYPNATSNELEYYLKKYLFLKDSGIFQKIDIKRRLSGRISIPIIKQQLANVNNLVFQVTNLCNLSCIYCCYGDLYENTGRDTLHNIMEFDKAKKIIDYLQEYWNSDANLSHKEHIMIGFYGGEPLTNFNLIQQIIEYTKKIHLKNGSTFQYNMTTNAMLLDRYMDFLVKHDILLLLSLDGNELHNSLRVDKQGKNSFKQVYQNIKLLQQKYPKYFEHNVRFNSVLNKYSNAADVQEFIYKEFQKDTGIETITLSGVKKEKMDLFYNLYRSYSDSKKKSSKNQTISRTLKNVGYFFYYHIGNAYRHYIDLLAMEKKELPRFPTGTCLPFWKKIFITPGGGIYACERIGFQHILGQISQTVDIDFGKIADKYNNYYDAISLQCIHCYQADSCPLCMMQFKQKNGVPICPSVTTKMMFKEYLSNIMSHLENTPSLYNKVNKMIFA